MKTVTIKKSVLLSKIKANRDAHKELYEKAVEGYQQELIEKLTALLARAKKKEDTDHRVDLDKPHNHLEDYDRAIAMLEMHTESKVTLTELEFDNFVLDNWSWKKMSDFTNSFYASKLAK